MYAAPRLPRFMSNSLSMRPAILHSSAQTPQPTHLSMSMYRGFRTTRTVKLPTWPCTSLTSAYVTSSMFSCLAASTILGVSMHAEQSSVGKVLSSCAILPPMLGSLSRR